jgi:hypothetical protein
VAEAQTETVSGLLLGSLGIKSHLDAGAIERHKEYYMGEGGGFPPNPGHGESCESRVARGLS